MKEDEMITDETKAIIPKKSLGAGEISAIDKATLAGIIEFMGYFQSGKQFMFKIHVQENRGEPLEWMKKTMNIGNVSHYKGRTLYAITSIPDVARFCDILDEMELMSAARIEEIQTWMDAFREKNG